MASYRRHIREKKSCSKHNKVRAVMDIVLDIAVQKKPTDAEGYSGLQIIPMGPSDNPQLFMHVELMGLEDGFEGNDIKLSGEDYCDSDDMST